MTNRRKSLALLSAGLLSSGLALAQAPAAPAAGLVSIGVIADTQSVMSSLGGAGLGVAAQIAIEDFGNSALGKPIQFKAADHANKPDIGSALAREWYDGGTNLILVGSNSAVGLAVNNLAKDKNGLMILLDAISDKLVEEDCNGHGMTWLWSAYSIVNVVTGGPLKSGTKTWYTLGVDNVGGRTWDDMAKELVNAAGGKVISAFHPLDERDYSSHLLKAQASGADALMITNAGANLTTEMKQVKEYRIGSKGMKIFLHTGFISDIHAAGLDTYGGTEFTTAFYWDLNDQTRAFAKKYFAKQNAMPTMSQAAAYSATMHFLKSVKAAGTTDADKVAAKMRELPVVDAFTKKGALWPNGRMVHEMYRVQVKTKAESKYPWDYYKVLEEVPGERAFQPLSASRCPLVKK
jgi:branched-chain amino acid transport system substrate-binding protein